jgi:hypothetical protein
MRAKRRGEGDLDNMRGAAPPKYRRAARHVHLARADVEWRTIEWSSPPHRDDGVTIGRNFVIHVAY